MLVAVVFLLFLVQEPVLAANKNITGTVDRANVGDKRSYLQVVVRSNTGEIIECVPVTHQLTFVLYQVVELDGFHVVHLSGSTEWEFIPYIISLSNGSLTAAYRRMNPLELPSSIQRANDTLTIHFTSSTPTAYILTRSKWRLGSFFSIQRLLFVLAFAFIVSFPHFFRQLPKEVQDELVGEKEHDTRDPNRVIKALIGEPSVSQT